MNDINSKGIDAAESLETSAKPKWEKPEITDFKPITVARGNGTNSGEGFNNVT